MALSDSSRYKLWSYLTDEEIDVVINNQWRIDEGWIVIGMLCSNNLMVIRFFFGSISKDKRGMSKEEVLGYIKKKAAEGSRKHQLILSAYIKGQLIQ